MNYYEALGLDPSATSAEIELAYRTLVHEATTEAARRQINTAFLVLGQADSRHDYDYRGRPDVNVTAESQVSRAAVASTNRRPKRSWPKVAFIGVALLVVLLVVAASRRSAQSNARADRRGAGAATLNHAADQAFGPRLAQADAMYLREVVTVPPTSEPDYCRTTDLPADVRNQDCPSASYVWRGISYGAPGLDAAIKGAVGAPPIPQVALNSVCARNAGCQAFEKAAWRKAWLANTTPIPPPGITLHSADPPRLIAGGCNVAVWTGA